MNLVICTPSVGQCKFGYSLSLARLVAYFSQHRVYPEVEQQQLDILGIEGSGVSSAREDFVRRFLAKQDATHLLFIDEDMIFAPMTLHTLASRRLPIVGCNYRKRVPPAPFISISADKTRRIETTKESTGLEPAYYIGFGFTLLERKVFEAMTPPMFMLEWTASEQTYTTEDHIFFREAQKAGFQAYVDHDASKYIGHVGGLTYRWDRDYAPFEDKEPPHG